MRNGSDAESGRRLELSGSQPNWTLSWEGLSVAPPWQVVREVAGHALWPHSQPSGCKLRDSDVSSPFHQLCDLKQIAHAF